MNGPPWREVQAKGGPGVLRVEGLYASRVPRRFPSNPTSTGPALDEN